VRTDVGRVALATGARGDLDDAVTGLHLVRADPHPEAVVPPLIHLGLLCARGGADAEAGRGVVGRFGGLPGVDGVVIVGGNISFQPSRLRALGGLRDGVVFTVAVRIRGLFPRSRRLEAAFGGVVHNLRVGLGRVPISSV
jgi:hypothetical protein